MDNHHWSLIQTNGFNIKINLAQYYSKEGEQKVIRTLLKGEPRGFGCLERMIVFDKDYVNGYIINKVFQPLVATNLKMIFSILFAAFFQYCQQVNSKLSLKVYKLHGEYVVKLTDIGIDYKELEQLLEE